MGCLEGAVMRERDVCWGLIARRGGALKIHTGKFACFFNLYLLVVKFVRYDLNELWLTGRVFIPCSSCV